MIALHPWGRAAIVLGAALALGAAWTLYQRHDAVADYKRDQAAQIDRQRAADRATAQETREDVQSLDDRELRDAVPVRVPSGR